MPDCPACPLVEWLAQKRANARAIRMLAERDIEAWQGTPEPEDEKAKAHREGLLDTLGITLGNARTTEDLCTTALEQRPKEE